jgi:hypothetical protein
MFLVFMGLDLRGPPLANLLSQRFISVCCGNGGTRNPRITPQISGMEDVQSTNKPLSIRKHVRAQIRRLKEQIAEAERQGRPANLARQLLEILEPRQNPDTP